MKKPLNSPAYVAALQSYVRAIGRGKFRKAIANMATNGGYKKVTTDTNELYVQEDTTISDSKILMSLSHRALQLAVKIIAELEFNNALWYFDHTKNKRDAKAISELRTKGILIRTEDVRIHFVNPELIRKGNIAAVAAHTAHITQHDRVSKEMIRPLNRRDIQISQFDLLQIPQQ